MGRQPGPVNSPRPIDIDILFYGNQVISAPALTIPHPGWRKGHLCWCRSRKLTRVSFIPVTGKQSGKCCSIES